MKSETTHYARRRHLAIAIGVTFVFFLFAPFAKTFAPPTALAETPRADLELTAAFPAAEINTDETFVTRYRILNHGPAAATRVTFRLTLPQSVIVESVEAERGQCVKLDASARDALRCDIGRLAAGKTVSIVLNARATDSKATFSLRARVQAKTADANKRNNRVVKNLRVQRRHPPPEAPIILTVNDTADTDDGDCNGASGDCTLREAINVANANLDPDTIGFNFSGAAPYTIALGSALPSLTNRVTIDGTSEPDWVATAPPIVVLNGIGAGSVSGLILDAGSDNSIIKGLVIQNFAEDGIVIRSNDNTIQTNCIGTTFSCADNGDNRNGIVIESGAARNVIGGSRASQARCDGDCNVISSHRAVDFGRGIWIRDSGSVGNTITGNFIGVNWNATLRLPNTIGILIQDASDNIIGGPNHSAGNFEDNVIAGNNSHGIFIRDATATNNKIVGNRIGNEPTEDVNVSNLGVGIELRDSNGNIIGTAAPGEQNTITGNESDAILLNNAKSNSINGNRIGTNAAGDNKIQDSFSADITNAADGILIKEFLGASRDNLILGNVISFNSANGITIQGGANTGNQIRGNFIGVPIAGSISLGNSDNGIDLAATTAATMGTLIGGATLADRNIISDNAGVGISMFRSNGNTVQGNYIGVAADAVTETANGDGGIQLLESSSNLIGDPTVTNGTCDKGCNIIAQNRAEGILIESFDTTPAHFNRIAGNSIYGNALKGISLVPAPNNGNDLQSFQTISIAAAASTTIAGTFTGTLGISYRLEFFYNRVAGAPPTPGCDGSGFGEGQIYIGFLDVMGVGAPAPFFYYAPIITAPIGSQVTGTATDLSNLNTSEFSNCVTVEAATATPTITATATNTATPSATATNTPTSSATATNTPTSSATATSTTTPSNTPKPTKTYTPTYTPFGPTKTNTVTPTHTPITPTITDTPPSGNNNPTKTFTPATPLIPLDGTPTETPTAIIFTITPGGAITDTPTATGTVATATTTATAALGTATSTETTQPSVTPAAFVTNTPTSDASATAAVATQTASILALTPGALETAIAQTQIAAAITSPTRAALALTETPGVATPAGAGVGTPTPTPTSTNAGGSRLGVAGDFPFINIGGLGAFNMNWWVENVRTPTQAFSGGLAKTLPNLLLALLLALLFGFFGTLQSNTMEQHEEEISGWFMPLTRPLGALIAAGAAFSANLSARGLSWLFEAFKLLGVLFILGAIFSFLDPNFSFTHPGWLLMIASVMLSVGLIGLIDDVAIVLYSRRNGGGGEIGLNGSNAAIALGSMVFSRLVGLAPGIIFGSAGSAHGELRGRPLTQSLLGIGAVAGVAGLAWLASAFIPTTTGASLWFATLIILIFAVGIQTLFFELLPMPGNMGSAIFKQRKGLWIVGFATAAFLFIQTQLNPDGNFIGAFNRPNMQMLALLTAVFCVLSGGVWFFFWNRDRKKA